MFNANQRALIHFVERHAKKLPVAERIAVYRGLSDLVEARELIVSLGAKARTLEEAEAKCDELNLKFDEPKNGGPP